MKKARINWIDQLKGVAIMLVVFGHAAGGLNDALSDPSVLLENIHKAIYSFHMPLCMIISGFVFYEAYVRSRDKISKKVLTHAMDMTFVYVWATLLMFLMKTAARKAVNNPLGLNDLLGAFVKPISGTGLWYLYLIVSIYIYIYIWKKPQFQTIEIIIFFLVSTFSVYLPAVEVLQISRLLFYAFFFGIGFWIAQRKFLISKWAGILFILLGIVLFVFCNCRADLELRWTSTSIGALISIGLFSLFQSKNDGQQYFIFLGRDMLTIYILHLFLVPLSRIIFMRFVTDNIYLILLITSFIGIFVPLGIGMIMRSIGIYNWAFRISKVIFRREDS